MGFNVSFIAVKGPPEATVLERLGMEATGRPGEAFRREAIGTTDSGWLIVTSANEEFATRARVEALSAGGEAIGLWCNEVVMASQAYGFRDGAEIWSIEYDCQVDPPADLVTKGRLPDAFPEVYERLKREQAKEDEEKAKAEADEDSAGPYYDVDHIYDLTHETVESVSGFRAGSLPEPDFREIRFPPKGLAALIGNYSASGLSRPQASTTSHSAVQPSGAGRSAASIRGRLTRGISR